MPTMTAISSAISGVPRMSKICRNSWFSSSMKMSASALPIISTTGSSTANSVTPKRRAVRSRSRRRLRRNAVARRSVGRGRPSTTTHRPASFPNSGPGDDDRRDRDGHAERQGDAEVGVEQADRGQRAGVRRHEAVHRGKACQRRDSDGDQRQLRAPGDQVDHRHQQHQADLEEHRQADDRADQRHRPRQRPRRGVADDGVDDLVGAAGVGEQFGEHRAERDQDADAGRGRAEPVGERLENVGRGSRRRRCRRSGAPKISARNGCSLATVISTTITAMPASERQDQLPAGCHRFGEFGVIRQDGDARRS